MGTDQDVLVAQGGERWRWIQTWMSWLHREVDTDLDVLVAQRPEFLLLVPALVQVVHVHLLAEDGERRLCCLAHLLVHTLSLNNTTPDSIIRQSQTGVDHELQ